MKSKKGSLLLFFVAYSCIAFSQYWQQKVEYKMDIEMIDSVHQYTGNQHLTYYNNSPDTLFRVFYHLYNNAFQPGSVMDIRSQNLPDPEKPTLKIQDYNDKQKGFLRVNSITQNGKELAMEEQGTILMVWLDKPLLPGKKTVLIADFLGQSGLYTRRSGRNNREGIDYSMAQWYPKLCEYDRGGWHADPYVGREYYGVWGDFEVNITIASDYILGGTGSVINPKDVKNGYGGYEGKPEGEKVTWKFRAKQVHDFVWAADKEYVHRIVPVDEDLKVHLLYLNDSTYAGNWEQLAEEMPRMVRFANKKYGKYPYENFSIIQGGDRGMEYPMATLMNGNRTYGSLLGTTAHEFMHQWYYGVLGSNEADYPWMDEGFSNYADAVLMNYMLNNDSVSIPSYDNPRKKILWLINSDSNVPLRTHGDHYSSSYIYGIGSYNKGTYYLHQLAYIIGQEKLDATLLRYFEEWKFKHPRPEDFMLLAEKVSGIELNWYNDYYVYSIAKLDYGIKTLRGNKEETSVVLERLEDFIMPVDLEVVLKSGESFLYSIPLDLMRGSKEKNEYENYEVLPAWDWVKEEYAISLPFDVNDIYYLIIDPDTQTLDINLENNYLIIDEAIEADVIIQR
jgi:hypothetical protein